MNNQLDAQQLAKQAFAPIAAIWSNVDSARLSATANCCQQTASASIFYGGGSEVQQTRLLASFFLDKRNRLHRKKFK